MSVYKNSLTELALNDLGLPDLGEVLYGPSAFVFVSGDPVASAKVLKNYARTNPRLELKGGLLDGQVLSAEQLQAVADLPSREELVARLLGVIGNPLTSLVRVLNGPMSSFARVLAAISEKSEAA
jgi:large subunit ribosomal protein L10